MKFLQMVGALMLFGSYMWLGITFDTWGNSSDHPLRRIGYRMLMIGWGAMICTLFAGGLWLLLKSN